MKTMYSIIPAASGPIVIFAISAAILLGILFVLGAFAYASHYNQFEVSPEGLTIRGDIFYGRHLPAASLLPGEARLLNLNENQDLRLKRRTNGAGLPGYASGWFRLGNGKKALVFVTDRSRVIHLPTRDGFSLLLSVTEPERFLETLQEVVKTKS